MLFFLLFPAAIGFGGLVKRFSVAVSVIFASVDFEASFLVRRSNEKRSKPSFLLSLMLAGWRRALDECKVACPLQATFRCDSMGRSPYTGGSFFWPFSTLAGLAFFVAYFPLG